MKKLLMRAGLAAGTLGLVVAGAAAFSAFEAHVVNVTATINNAAQVDTASLTFGNVFPQEVQIQPVTFSLSDSFLSASNTLASTLSYVLKQKPKCAATDPANPVPFAEVTDVPGVNDGPVTFTCPTGYAEMPLLCPYLSKTGSNEGDQSVPSFHGPTDLASWTDAVSVATEAGGSLSKQGPTSDTWNIDLHTPCFKGECAQDWDSFVTGTNQAVTTTSEPYTTTYYQADPSLKGQAMGCDLWFEVDGIPAIPLPTPGPIPTPIPTPTNVVS